MSDGGESIGQSVTSALESHSLEDTGQPAEPALQPHDSLGPGASHPHSDPDDRPGDDARRGRAKYLRDWASPPPHNRVRDDVTAERARELLAAELPAGPRTSIDAILELDFAKPGGLTANLLNLSDDPEFTSALNDDAVVDKPMQIHHLANLVHALFRNDAPGLLAKQIRTWPKKSENGQPRPLADEATLDMLPPKVQDVIQSIDRARGLKQSATHWSFALCRVSESESFTGVTDLTSRRCEPEVDEILDGLDDSSRGPFGSTPIERAEDVKSVLFKLAHGHISTEQVMERRGASNVKVVRVKPQSKAAADINDPEAAVAKAYLAAFEVMLRRGNALSWVSTHLHPGILLLLHELGPASKYTFEQLSPKLVDITFRRLAAAFPCLRELGLLLADAVLQPLRSGQDLTNVDPMVLKLLAASRLGTLTWRVMCRIVGLI